MKYQKFLLWPILVLGYVISKNIDYAYHTDNLKYNLSWLEDNRGVCKFLEKELYEAVRRISKITSKYYKCFIFYNENLLYFINVVILQPIITYNNSNIKLIIKYK